MRFEKGHIPWNKNKCWSEEIKEKLKKNHWSKRDDFIPPLLGMHHTEKAKRKMSLSHKDKKFSENHRKNISEGLKRYWRKFDKKTIKLVCKNCNKFFETYRNRHNGFCSYKCYWRWRNGKHFPNLSLALAKRNFIPWNKGLTKKVDKRLESKRIKPKIEKICQICNKKFLVHPYRKNTARFCSEQCRVQYLIQVTPLIKNTDIEKILQDILKNRGINFEVHKSIFGHPDIFIKPNICIFADGSYWHSLPKAKERDSRVNKFLTEKNYKILRFSETDIKKNVSGCINKIFDVMHENNIKNI